MSFWKNTNNRLLLILLFAAVLRFNNLTVGFPGLYVSNDEAILHLSALNILANKTVFSLGNYGPLASYVQIPFLIIGYFMLLVSGKVHSIADLEFLLLTQEGYFMFIPRVISALFGTLTVLAVYRLSYALFKNKHAALWSALFCAVSFNLVHISHLARSMAPALFFCVLTALFTVNSTIDKNNAFKNRLLAFVFSAIGFGFHQIAGVVVVLPILVHLKNLRTQFTSGYYLMPFIVWLALIALFNFLSLRGNINDVFRFNNTLGLIRTPDFWLAKNIREILSTLLENIKIFWELVLTEGLILFFALYGFYKGKFDSRIKSAFTVYFLICIFLSALVFPPILRYFLPAIIFLPVFAGLAAYQFLEKRNILIALVVIVIASFNSLYWNMLISKGPTFVQMREWVDGSISPDTPIAVTYYRTVGYVPSKSASEIIRQFKPQYYKRSSEILENNQFPYNVRNIVYLEVFNKESKMDNLNAGLSVFPAKYIIDAYYQKSERLLHQKSDMKLVAHFSPTGEYISQSRIPQAFADAAENFPLFITNRPGPYFDILKIEYLNTHND